MICDHVLMRVDHPDGPVAGSDATDHVDLDWTDCRRRFQRLTSCAGRDVGLLMPAGTVLRHGDVLHTAPEFALVVRVKPCPVLVVRCSSVVTTARVAYELGDRHVPMQVARDGVLTPEDDAVAAILDRLGAPYVLECRRFEPLPSSAAPAWAAAPVVGVGKS